MSKPSYQPSSHRASTLLMFSSALLCAAMLGVHGYTSQRRESHTSEKVLQLVLTSMEKLVDFFDSSYSNMNVDCLFGVRVGQGSMNQTLADCFSAKLQCPDYIVERISELNRRIENIVEKAVPYVKALDEEYFGHFSPAMDGPYILQYKEEVLQNPIFPSFTVDNNYNEDEGDRCLSLVMGKYENQPACSIPDDCLKLMMRTNTAGYFITHQLLYFIVIDRTGCNPTLIQKMKDMHFGAPRNHKTELCKHILAETIEESKTGNVNETDQDLFLEQCVLCGIIGFQNFMNKKWVNMVLSWQSPEGCFPLSKSLFNLDNEIAQLATDRRRLLKLVKMEADTIQRSSSPVTGRKLLREQFMDDDCLAHKTGLGIGLVGAYVRHYVRLTYGVESNPSVDV